MRIGKGTEHASLWYDIGGAIVVVTLFRSAKTKLIMDKFFVIAIHAPVINHELNREDCESSCGWFPELMSMTLSCKSKPEVEPGGVVLKKVMDYYSNGDVVDFIMDMEPARPKVMTKADKQALELLPDDWFSAKMFPPSIRNPLARCQRLVSFGKLETKLVGDSLPYDSVWRKRL